MYLSYNLLAFILRMQIVPVFIFLNYREKKSSFFPDGIFIFHSEKLDCRF